MQEPIDWDVTAITDYHALLRGRLFGPEEPLTIKHHVIHSKNLYFRLAQDESWGDVTWKEGRRLLDLLALRGPHITEEVQKRRYDTVPAQEAYVRGGSTQDTNFMEPVCQDLDLVFHHVVLEGHADSIAESIYRIYRSGGIPCGSAAGVFTVYRPKTT